MLAVSTGSGAGLPLLLLVTVGLIAPLATAADPAPIAWRTDYNAARKEAQDKGLPLLLVVGTEECFYCRKLETNTFRDVGVASQISGNFVALKVDANLEPAFAKALKV